MVPPSLSCVLLIDNFAIASPSLPRTSGQPDRPSVGNGRTFLLLLWDVVDRAPRDADAFPRRSRDETPSDRREKWGSGPLGGRPGGHEYRGGRRLIRFNFEESAPAQTAGAICRQRTG